MEVLRTANGDTRDVSPVFKEFKLVCNKCGNTDPYIKLYDTGMVISCPRCRTEARLSPVETDDNSNEADNNATAYTR